MTYPARIGARLWWVSVLIMAVIPACNSVHLSDSSDSYTIEQNAGVATLTNSATVVLYSVNGKKIPANFEENAVGRLGKKSYASLVEKENAISPGFHCLLFQSVYNNEMIQIPFYAQLYKKYKIIKYSVPKNSDSFSIGSVLDLFIFGLPMDASAGAFNSLGYFSVYDTDKVANVALEPTGDGTGDYDRRFKASGEEALFREVFEHSEITAILQSGKYHRVFFSNFAETGFQLARKNVTDDDVVTCPPVRVMMANGVDDKYLTYLRHPPSLNQ